MVGEMRLPQFDMLDADADILQWLKKEGDQVSEGEPVVEVETAKAVGGLEAPASGVLVRIVAPVGATVTSGTVLAVIESA
ncbi:MAG: biotin attachment protein [Deltaproteobacteria bacterium]|nr:biotin attachment protein [Deltaproteobacteria bacterium]